jgi:alkanesulfonate monooxygenase SsuD/methylene tetrahydromethanopterin reductase-like flavin-dependent oxidoreductase (luciferase family)
MIERSGFGDDITGFDEAMQAGDVERAKQAISDRFLDDLTAIGTPDEVRAGVQRYADAGTTSPCIGGVPRTDFDATLEAVKPR